MPVLSLHNSYNLPSGSASYSLGLSGAPVMPSYTHPSISGVVGTGVPSSVLGSGLTGANTAGAGTNLYPLSGMQSLTNTLPPSYGVGSTSYTTYTNPILTSKLKQLDDIDLAVGRYGNRSSPCSPIPPNSWGLDGYSDGVNPGFMHTQRSLGLGALDLESNYNSFIYVLYNKMKLTT